MIQKLHKEAHVLWQTPEEDSIPERALIIESYSDVICIKQDGDDIHINYGSIDELCKLFRRMKKAREEYPPTRE